MGKINGKITNPVSVVGESVQLLYTASGWVVIGGNNFVTT